jgi:hypothetical protein
MLMMSEHDCWNVSRLCVQWDPRLSWTNLVACALETIELFVVS